MGARLGAHVPAMAEFKDVKCEVRREWRLEESRALWEAACCRLSRASSLLQERGSKVSHSLVGGSLLPTLAVGGSLLPTHAFRCKRGANAQSIRRPKGLVFLLSRR